ncbi:hypothetical protein [Cupriavidus metallidurans]|uniref:hypothetical protein n=1 Tax=Cupriavidus metallidurans TaxID=119219 RepID=UPI001CC99D10|nr:hypothetical protein [Cupriavidus metallidurans]UBM08024.1 hypothetical protein LAI70_10020 [Cupriavidus metallidurans]
MVSRVPRKPTPAAGKTTSVQTRVDGPVVIRPIPIPIPLPVAPDPNQNFFDAGRPGQPVVRQDDLLVLRVELNNLTVQRGSPPRLRKTGSGVATLVLHFPPQSIFEQAFAESSPPAVDPPVTLPARARIAGESRIAFAVPDGFDIPYTLEGVLTAVRDLPLAVGANALPPTAAQPPLSFPEWLGGLIAQATGSLTLAQRAALPSITLRNLKLASVQRDTSTLERRQVAPATARRRAALPAIDVRRGVATDVGLGPILSGLKPRPAEPTAQQTALEVPWRLILSPDADERWHHAVAPVTTPDGHTELWHTQLVAPTDQGTIVPPHPDPNRIVRAVWALAGEGTSKPMQAKFPAAVGELPAPVDMPFKAALNDMDRYSIVHLSSNFSRSGYTPAAIPADQLMLSALGAWINVRGVWDGPQSIDLVAWTHRGSMGRDHYVRTVKRGFLWPFGHRAVLVEVTERKFQHGGVPGNAAVLRKRTFIIVRERERAFTETDLRSGIDGRTQLHLQMPLTSVRILSLVTPDLSPVTPTTAPIWPLVGGVPFPFRCEGTDLDGRAIRFDLPMVFMYESIAMDPSTANDTFAKAQTLWDQGLPPGEVPGTGRGATMAPQSMTLARSAQPGDTMLEVRELRFGAEAGTGNPTLKAYGQTQQRPAFYPKVVRATVRIPALAQLTGSGDANVVEWNNTYLVSEFGADNKGQVFVNIVPDDPKNQARLDFSAQGDRAGGFVQPNLSPSAVSRLTGPVTGTVNDFVGGRMTGSDAFPGAGLPNLPLLFGCIPLGAVIETVTSLVDTPEQVPRFVSECGSQAELFLNGLAQLYAALTGLAGQTGSAATGGVSAIGSTVADLKQQAATYAPGLVADAQARLDALQAALTALSNAIAPLVNTSIDAAPALPNLATAITAVQSASDQLRATAGATVAGVSLPAGLRQSLIQATNVATALAGDLGTVAALVAEGKALFAALDAILGDPKAFQALLSDPEAFFTHLKAVQNALAPLRNTLANFRLLEGAARQTLLNVLDAMMQALAVSDDVLRTLLQVLFGDELTIRFNWNPRIASWPASGPIFHPNDPAGFSVAVEAKVKKSGGGQPKLTVVSSLKHFDLILIGAAGFLELNFEKIEFRVGTADKMNVDVLLNDIKFIGPLSFVETLRDLIPLDGFSDPPYLDISTQGIDAGFNVALPSISVGMFNLSNLALGAGFTVPFIGQPLAVRFNFCTREQPFNLSVCMFGGGGFFGITLDPGGIQLLEASFEFGASISVNLGVASGGVHVMAGIYFRMEQDNCALTGYFRLGGSVSVLGLITASIELYLALAYESQSGKCVGRAQLTIEVEVFLFSTSVTISCERKFAGANGDPTFRELMGLQPALPLTDELALIHDDTEYAWRQYAEAFA